MILTSSFFVILANAEIQTKPETCTDAAWNPAFAGMTGEAGMTE